MTERITDDSGNVAVRHFRQIQKLVQVHGREYVFVVRASISLAFVHPDDVDALLGMLGGCCGQRTKPVFGLADETHVRRWRNNGGR